MTRLYACIISTEAKANNETLIWVAGNFAHSIERLDDGILFDVSGLERLIGEPKDIAAKILGELRQQNIAGSVAVADTTDAAILMARQNKNADRAVHDKRLFSQLPLSAIGLERSALNVFSDLGLSTVEDLLAIPRDDLIARYGREFETVIKRIEQRGTRLLTPNIAESKVSWAFELDQAVEDFEQMIFIINHGLDDLFTRISHYSKSTEQLDISFRLANKKTRDYEIKTSFPTLERSFWLKLINLRVSMNAPEAAILSVKVTAHFTKPRPDQRGLYAVSRPEPEKLLLTVNKLKKLVGESNVGVPVLLDQRLAEPFRLEADALPQGKENVSLGNAKPVIAFNYFRPPLRTEVLIRDRRLIFIKTRLFAGHVINSSGVWKSGSKWWENSWKTIEWDIEVEGQGVYRLCKVYKEWFLAGEYD